MHLLDPHPTHDDPAAGGRWWRPLVDARLGIVRRIVDDPVPPHFPRSFRQVSAVLADATPWSPWPVDSCGAGYAVGNQPYPVAAAVGEALERYCGNLVTPTIHRSFGQLAAEGLRAVDPTTLGLFSDDQLRRPDFPFTPFTRDLATDWVVGRDLASGEPVHVPASLVWASYPGVTAGHGRAVTNPVHQPGLAAGQDLDHAVLSALLEIVERDAVVVAWHGGRELAPITVPAWLDRLTSGPAGRLDARFYAFPNPYGVDVVGALVRDRSTGYLTMGFAARIDRRDAVLKAFGEALQLQRFVADLDDPQGAIPTRHGATSPLKSWREDRRYLEDYADDLSDATDDGCNLQLHLDPRMQERVEQELARVSTGQPVDATALEPADSDEPAGPVDPRTAVHELVARISDVTGATPVMVDVTTPDVVDAAVDARVVRVVAPGTYGNTAVAHPFLGGSRADEVGDGRRHHRPLPLPH